MSKEITESKSQTTAGAVLKKKFQSYDVYDVCVAWGLSNTHFRCISLLIFPCEYFPHHSLPALTNKEGDIKEASDLHKKLLLAN